MRKDRISIYDEGETDGTTAGTKLIDCKVENVAGSDDAVNYGIYTDDSAPWTLEDILSGSPRGKSLSVLPKTSVSLCMMRP